MVGNAGEFYVMAELTRRGWTAAMTARNNRAYDIIAKKAERYISLRVKTKTAKSSVFRWNARKDDEIFLELSRKRNSSDYCVLVDIPEGEQHPVFYVVPTHEINSWLKSDFEKWVETPGRKGRRHNPTNKVRLFYVDKDESRLGHGYAEKLGPYRNAWGKLEANVVGRS